MYDKHSTLPTLMDTLNQVVVSGTKVLRTYKTDFQPSTLIELHESYYKAATLIETLRTALKTPKRYIHKKILKDAKTFKRDVELLLYNPANYINITLPRLNLPPLPGNHYDAKKINNGAHPEIIFYVNTPFIPIPKSQFSKEDIGEFYRFWPECGALLNHRMLIVARKISYLKSLLTGNPTELTESAEYLEEARIAEIRLANEYNEERSTIRLHPLETSGCDAPRPIHPVEPPKNPLLSGLMDNPGEMMEIICEEVDSIVPLN